MYGTDRQTGKWEEGERVGNERRGEWEQGEREEEGTESPCAAKLRTKFKIPLLYPLKCQEITSVHHHTGLNIDF